MPELASASDLYRIAQEAIRNAARHSGAAAIELQLAIEPERLVVAVEDDGIGMPQHAETRGGMGLKIMRYRASIIGALLDIEPREGGGTVVRCTFAHPTATDTEEIGNGRVQRRGNETCFVVDDHPIVRQGLVQLIEQEPDLRFAGRRQTSRKRARA